MKPLAPHAQAIFDMARGGARVNFERFANVAPVMFTSPPIWRAPIATLPLSGVTKADVNFAMTRFMNAGLIVCIVAEIWMTFLEKGSAVHTALASDGPAVTVPPRLNPSRSEAVAVQLRLGTRAIFATALITRPATGKPTLGEWSVMDNTEDGCELKAGTFHQDENERL